MRTKVLLSPLVHCAIIVAACTCSAAAQTPFAVGNVAEPPAAPSIRGASAGNPWFGAQLGYKFGASDELADNLLVSASFIYSIPLDPSRNFQLPVISNFAHLVASPEAETESEGREDALKELLLSRSGVRAGLYPYRKVASLSRNDFSVLIHGESSWKINAFKNESEAVDYVNQFRLGAGFELALGVESAEHKPLTLSVTPVFTFFDEEEYEKVFAEPKSGLRSLEIVGVLPIAARTGLLFEYVRGDVQAFRAGIIVATAPR
jgi:hypothetical protein